MAGESPDKSEQQKSSGTARSESDPRLAVFREPSVKDGTEGGTDTATAVFRAGALAGADDEGEGAGGTDGSDAAGADTATAVFRTRPVEDGEGREDAEEPGAAGADSDADEPEGSEGPESAADADVAEGAGKGAGGREGASGAPEGVDEGAAGAADEDGDADAADSDADEPGSDADAVNEPAKETAETVTEDTESGSKASEDSEGSESDESGESAEPGEGDARLRAAVAAWVTEDGDEEEAAKGGTPEPAESGTKDESGTDSDAPEADADDDADEAKADTSGSAADAADEKTSADADADVKTEKDTKAEKAEKDTKAAGAAESEAGSDADAKDAEDGEGDKAAKDAKNAKDGAKDDDADGDDKGGIDQPTAIFRAPAAARVDQPTTALKVISPDSKQASEPASKPESSAERTSKFVPLRGDDARPAPAPRGSGTPAAATPAAATPGTPPPASLSTAERTTQQPMPPKPPLDLLAELTNTPPPPETPVRTAVRRVKIWTPLVLLLLIVFAIVQMMRPLPDPKLGLSVKSTHTFEGQRLELDWPSQGQSAVSVDGVGSMGSSGAQKPAPIASVAKVMTAYVVLKDHPLTGKEEGEKITVDQQAEDESKRDDESTAPIRKGQQFTQKQLLQLLMIPSGNNAARLLARWDSPSEKEFVAKMNAAAKELGMTNTTYTDPSGLDKATVSTAEDQIKLARAVMQNDVFRGIVDTPQIKIPGIDQVIYNNNTILLEPGVSGIKTGSSTPAGGNLLWSANTVVDGKKLWIYGAVMGQQAGTGQPYDSLAMSLENSLKVIKGAQKAVTSAQVVKKGDVVGYVDDGLGGRTAVVATRNLKAKGWPGLKVELSISDNGKKIPHSASAGTEVGVVTVGTGPGKVSAPVALREEMKSPGFSQKLTRIG
ncbi:serine hydrolase [Streptomyces sp. NPDC059605]|uniref:serine hydrolase n=1 Tax=unclassified Streptomyces TaxID=2593676 RepID=UPI003690F5B1